MDFLEAVRIRAFQKDATFLPQYFKGAQFDRSLTKKEEEYARSSVFKISVSGQKVYIYDRTHIPAITKPVVRIQV